MSYIVLARKYRPQTFTEVYAQEHVTEILHNAILSSRIAHAYLFTGPRGVGKTSMARIMAKNLNCVEGPTVTPCNVCHNCVEITAGTSTDVIEIDGASTTGVDDIRDLQKELLYAPSHSKYKIYIIDEVHMLSKNAFNALLKTLEEPPENVLFIFATTEPYKVLPTIISRCQRYDFKRIPIEAIVRRLKELTGEEQIEIDNESLHMIARKADGSLRDALSLLDQVLSYSLNKVTIDKVREIFGLIPTQVYCNLLKLIKAQDEPALLAELQRIFEHGTDLQDLVNSMLEFLRLVILRKLGMAPAEVTAEEYPVYDEIAGLFSQTGLMYMMSFLMHARGELKSSGNPYLILEMLMLKFCQLDEIEDVASILESLGKGGKSLPQRSEAPKPAPRQAAPVSPAESQPQPVTRAPEPVSASHFEFTQENLAQAWERIIARIRSVSPVSALALAKAEYSVLDNFKLRLQLAGNTNYQQVLGNKDTLQQVLAEVFGKPIRLELEQLQSTAPTQVEIVRKNLDDLKNLDDKLARFIEITDSRLSQ